MNLENERDSLKDAINELKANVYKRELKMDSTDSTCQVYELEISQLKEAVNELESKRVQDGNALTRARVEIKELEKQSTSAKLDYETQKEQCELVLKENALLVLLTTKYSKMHSIMKERNIMTQLNVTRNYIKNTLKNVINFRKKW